MTKLYEHATNTSSIVVTELRDGATDIIMRQSIGTNVEDVMRYPLPNNECDKLGAVLCRDIIDNYTGHNSHLKDKIADLEDESRDVRYCNATLRDEKAELESRIHNLRDHVREHNRHEHQLCARIEYLEAINKGHDDCKEAFFKLLDKRSELESTNRGLEQDISNLRIANALYRKRWNDRNDLESESHSIQSINFERMIKGYHGVLSRQGKTIVITLPFEHESVARNAEKYIVGMED